MADGFEKEKVSTARAVNADLRFYGFKFHFWSKETLKCAPQSDSLSPKSAFDVVEGLKTRCLLKKGP